MSTQRKRDDNKTARKQPAKSKLAKVDAMPLPSIISAAGGSPSTKSPAIYDISTAWPPVGSVDVVELERIRASNKLRLTIVMTVGILMGMLTVPFAAATAWAIYAAPATEQRGLVHELMPFLTLALGLCGGFLGGRSDRTRQKL
jgi:hypothetical protein